jgi:hypothetical protein
MIRSPCARCTFTKSHGRTLLDKYLTNELTPLLISHCGNHFSDPRSPSINRARLPYRWVGTRMSGPIYRPL